MISCIILSAGFSQRFGSPKGLAHLSENQTVLERLLDMLLRTQVSEVIVVLGHQSSLLKPFLLNHKDVKVVYNNHYNFGQTSSVKVGVESVSSDSEAAMILPVDFPVIEAKTIDALIYQFKVSSPLLLLPTYKGKKGHPPLFSQKLYEEILALDNDRGLNTIGHRHYLDLTEMPVEDKGVCCSFNTLDEFDAIKKEFIL